MFMRVLRLQHRLLAVLILSLTLAGSPALVYGSESSPPASAPSGLPASPAAAIPDIRVLCYETSIPSCNRIKELVTNVTKVSTPSQISGMLDRYDVLYVAGASADTLVDYAAAIHDFVGAGGGLIVEQPNRTGTLPIMPASFEVFVSNHLYPGYPVKASTIVFTPEGAVHPILQGLQPYETAGNYDSVMAANLGAGYITLALVAENQQLASLAVGQYQSGRVIFHTGKITSDSVTPGSDTYIQNLFRYAARQIGDNPYDLSFRPTVNGYTFANYGPKMAPSAVADLGLNEVVQLLGTAGACWKSTGPCALRPAAWAWLTQVNRALAVGRGGGMGVTSLRFFTGADKPGDYQSGANSAYDLTQYSVREETALYWARQFTQPVALNRESARTADPNTILANLLSAMEAKSDPLLLFLRDGSQGGVLLVPYAAIEREPGVYHVLVYDPGQPNATDLYVEFGTGDHTWRYSAGWALWNGDAASGNLGLTALSEYAKPSTCDWCAGSTAATASAAGTREQFWLLGGGKLLLTDNQGRRLGQSGDQWLNEIPAGYADYLDGGLGADSAPVYIVPTDDTMQMTLDGATLASSTPLFASRFGPGFAAAVEDLGGLAGVQSTLTTVRTAARMTYQSSQQTTANMLLVVENATKGCQAALEQVDLAAGQPISLQIDQTSEHVVLHNAGTSSGAFDFRMGCSTGVGSTWFLHKEVALAAGETLTFDYGQWNGAGALQLMVDEGSDQTVEQTLSLDNELPRLFLPVVRR